MSRISKILLTILLVFSLSYNARSFTGPSLGGGGTGNVVGPATGTDTAIARFDGDGQHLQNSAVFLSDDRDIFGLRALEMERLISFINGGAAITGSSYQIGRDADTPNQLHFNVPTGASFEWSINDAPELTLNATLANFQNNDIQTTGRVAIGGDAVFGNDRQMDFSRTITSFTGPANYGAYTLMTLNPSVDVGTGSESFVSNEYFTEIPEGNTQNWNMANFSNAEFFFDNKGDGDVSAYIGLWGGANHYGDGDVTFEQVAGYFTAYNNGAGNISGTISKAGNFAVAAGTGNFGAGSIARDYVYYAESPWLFGGSIARHWGLYFEDQEFGTESWAIQTAGGKVEFGAPTGKNSRLILSDNDVTQQYTAFPANAHLDISPFSATVGGTTIASLTDGDTTALNLRGVFGTASPTTANAAFKFVGAKSNGAGGIQNLGNGDLFFEFINNSLTSQPAFMCNGGRLCGFSTEFPAARVHIDSNGSDSTTQSFQINDSSSSNTLFRVRNDGHVTVGNVTGGQAGFLNVNGANAAGGSIDSFVVNATLAAMNGSDTYRGIFVDIGNANHTGSSNAVRGIYIDGITFDADADATAIELGSGGWNYALKMPSGVGLRFGTVDVADSVGSLSIGAPLLVSGSGESTFAGPVSVNVGSGFGQVAASGSTGGCIMLRDSDNGGWTQCTALDGTLTCEADDGDGICD